MDSDSSSYYVTTYSQDERIAKQQLKERNLEDRRVAEVNQAREFVYEDYARSDLAIFDLPGIKFLTFRYNKIKLSFRPIELTKYVNPRVTFYVSLRFVGRYWRMKRDSLPVNCKWKVYKLFYDKECFAVTDNRIFEILMEIYQVLVEWAKNYERFRLNKFERYRRGEDVELDSDDELIFLSESQRMELHQKREQILQRMIPPKPKKRKRN